MKNVFILLLIMLMNNAVSSQDEIKKGTGDKFYYNSKSYKAKELKGILEKDEEALSIYQEAKFIKSTATILGISSLISGIAGGFLLHDGITNGKNPDGIDHKPFVAGYALILVSSGFGVLGIHNSTLAIRNIREAVDVFNRNNKIPKTGYLERTIDIKFSGSGLGIGMSF